MARKKFENDLLYPASHAAGQAAAITSSSLKRGTAEVSSETSMMTMLKQNLMKPGIIGLIAGLGSQVLFGGSIPLFGYSVPSGLVVGGIVFAASMATQWGKELAKPMLPDSVEKPLFAGLNIASIGIMAGLMSGFAYFTGGNIMYAAGIGAVSQVAGSYVVDTVLTN